MSSDSLDDARVARPFFLTAENVDTGLRFFGAPPRGVSPTRVGFRYLLTVPYDLGSAWELSVFIHQDLDLVLDGSGTLQMPGSELIDVVAHPRSPRGSQVEFGLGDVCYGGRLLEPIDDVVDGEVYSAHKLGGHPFFLHGEPRVEQPIMEAMRRDGYRQVIQLAFPAYAEDVDVDYDWPFGDGIFHLVARLAEDDLDWMALWE